MGRTSNLASLSVSALQRELERRQAKGNELARQRDRLLRQVASINAKIASHGGTANGRGGSATRVANTVTLPDALAAALKGKTMAIADAAAAVQKAGYKTNSSNFRVGVTIALGDKSRFKRVERGVYTAK